MKLVLNQSSDDKNISFGGIYKAGFDSLATLAGSKLTVLRKKFKNFDLKNQKNQKLNLVASSSNGT